MPKLLEEQVLTRTIQVLIKKSLAKKTKQAIDRIQYLSITNKIKPRGGSREGQPILSTLIVSQQRTKTKKSDASREKGIRL